MRKVYILYTGGTIGMIRNPKLGLVPTSGILEQAIKHLNLDKHFNLEYYIQEMNPLIDSSNMSQSDWVKMAKYIKSVYNKYDSFIIVHGTDTMAYTASALSFMLENLNKTVIITGAQIPLVDFRTDALGNLVNSFNLALFDIPEVIVCFGSYIIRGNRTVKLHADDFEAYESPNYPLLGEIGVTIRIHWNLVRKKNKKKLSVLKKFNEVIIYHIQLLPTDNGKVLIKLLELKPDAIIIGGYGIGNAPTDEPLFLDALKLAEQSNIIIVDTTQCIFGTVDLSKYGTGVALEQYSVIGALDMTVESAYGKLFYLFNKHKNKVKKIRSEFIKDLRGEITSKKRTIEPILPTSITKWSA